MDYQIEPIKTEGFSDATGVHSNQAGDWLGEFVKHDESGNVINRVDLYSDEDGDYIPAPSRWEDRIMTDEQAHADALDYYASLALDNAA